MDDLTRDGKPTAERDARAQSPLTADALLARWRNTPATDPRQLRAELDSIIDFRVWIEPVA